MRFLLSEVPLYEGASRATRYLRDSGSSFQPEIASRKPSPEKQAAEVDQGRKTVMVKGAVAPEEPGTEAGTGSVYDPTGLPTVAPYALPGPVALPVPDQGR